MVGLLVDRGGFPLEVGCFEGNKAETLTLLPIMRAFQARHGIEGLVVVADAGMLSAGNLKELDEAGLRFIVGSRVTKAPSTWRRTSAGTATRSPTGRSSTPSRLATAAGAPRTTRKLQAEPVWDPAEHAGSWRAVWAYSAKRAARDAKTLTAQENRAKAVIAGEKAARTPRFVTVKNGTTTLDEASLARARPAGRVEGVRHQHPRPGDARRRGHRQLPRPVAGGGSRSGCPRPTCAPGPCHADVGMTSVMPTSRLCRHRG